jgi:6-phosphogluconolactonase (cycloisomerase 2 family)
MRIVIRPAIALVVALVIGCPAAQAQQFPASASFEQLSGTDGCVLQEGTDADDGDQGCARARGLTTPVELEVSPDQKFVYVGSRGFGDLGSDAIDVFARDQSTGALTFKSCISDTGGDGRVGTDGFCTDGDVLAGVNDLAFSPDGRFLYVAAGDSSGVSWLARDPDTGALTQAGCVKAEPRLDHCGQAPALLNADSVAVSPDGRNVYVTAALSGAVTVFDRDATTGALTEAMCVSDSGSDGHCADGTGLRGASSVVVAADGNDVYVTAGEVGAITSYRRDPATGRITPADCLLDDAPAGGSCRRAPALAGASDAVLTPDGHQLLVASSEDSALGVFARDGGTGKLAFDSCFVHVDPQGDDRVNTDEGDDDAEGASTAECADAKALNGVNHVAVSPDGRGVFALSSGDYLAAFQRDPATGKLQQFGCAEEQQTYRSCAQSRNLDSGNALAVTNDARNLYVGTSSGVSVFAAAAAVTTRAAVLRDGAVRLRLACPAARARACAGRVGVARSGSSVRHYRVGRGHSARVVLRLSRTLRRAVARHRRVHVTVFARERGGRTHASTRRLTVRRR